MLYLLNHRTCLIVGRHVTLPGATVKNDERKGRTVTPSKTEVTAAQLKAFASSRAAQRLLASGAIEVSESGASALDVAADDAAVRARKSAADIAKLLERQAAAEAEDKAKAKAEAEGAAKQGNQGNQGNQPKGK